MRLVLLIAVALIASAAAPAAAQTETRCAVYAFVLDPSSGVNVRAGAGRNFRIVKTVPRDQGRTLFDVVGAKGDWLKVAYAVDSKNRNVFSGTGWVLAELLAVREKRENYRVFETPSTRGRRIDVSLFDHVLPLAGCRGEWVKVSLPATGTGVSGSGPTGWMPAGDYCGNPWMECRD